jgi:hypothetical protein
MAEKVPDAKIIGLDVDSVMLQKAELRFKSSILIGSPSFTPTGLPSVEKEDRIIFVHESYANIDNVLRNEKADFILLDLGVNLEHFLATERGFSLK